MRSAQQSVFPNAMEATLATRAPRRPTAGRLFFLDAPSRGERFADAVLEGLSQPRKTLPCRYFYDEAGSELFERITQLPEYYLTRSEEEILAQRAPEIASLMDPDFAIVEFGSGSSSKTRLLIRAALKNQRSLVYTPIDISGKFLRKCGRALVRDFSRLHIAGIAGEYRAALNALAPSVSARLFVFLGSNLGNFDPEQSCAFLSSVAARMGPKDKLLVGVDLAKDRSVLERAYDDASGVTPQFNKNLLARINRELGGSFDLGAFDHEARYVREKGRIEMRLVSKRRQRVRVASLGRRFEFLQGERILTEVSYKYSVPGLDALLEGSGLARERLWCDGLGRFADVVVSRTP